MASSYLAFQVNCGLQKPSISHNFNHLKTTLSSYVLYFGLLPEFMRYLHLTWMSYHEQPLLGELQQPSMRFDVSKTIKNTPMKLLDAFVDHMFEFVDQPLLPS